MHAVLEEVGAAVGAPPQRVPDDRRQAALAEWRLCLFIIAKILIILPDFGFVRKLETTDKMFTANYLTTLSIAISCLVWRHRPRPRLPRCGCRQVCAGRLAAAGWRVAVLTAI